MNSLKSAAEWLGIGSSVGLAWLENHMWMTGSSFTANHMRWAFTPPFYITLVMTSLSASFFYASLTSSRILRVAIPLWIGLGIPAVILITNYHCLGADCWYVRSSLQQWAIECYPMMISIIFTGWVVVMGFLAFEAIGNAFTTLFRIISNSDRSDQ